MITLWEKEKMLVTSIFTFYQHVFNPIKDINHHFSKLYFVICKCFQFGPVLNFVIWKRVKHHTISHLLKLFLYTQEETVADNKDVPVKQDTILEMPPVEKQRAIVKPHILTHVIEGFVIQEGPEPFPVCIEIVQGHVHLTF